MRFDWLWTLLGLGLLLAWDSSGLDLLLAMPWGGTHGFALRDHWFVSRVLHDGAHNAAWLPALWLVAGIWWPLGPLKRLGRPERLQWAWTTLGCLAVIALLKRADATACPWDLLQFGGQGHGAHCFPAGHASSGFAFISGYFALRASRPRQASYWLLGSLWVGLVLGLAQQLRGAHFMSHTLWTAWLCWTTAWLMDLAIRSRLPSVSQRDRPAVTTT